MLQSKWATPATANAVAPACDDMDPFAQTASTDDLFFDDDMTPIEAPVALQGTAAKFVPEAPRQSPLTTPHAHPPPQAPREAKAAERGSRGRGRSRGRARGRGGGGGGRGAYSDVRLEEKEPPRPQPTTTADPAPAAAAAEPKPASASASASASAATPTPPTENAPVESAATPKPTESKEKPTLSVRGDRTLTGGAARTRLTEAQLNAKLANMRSKNEALQTAHARAEADQAHFEAREAVLKKKDVERKKALAERQKAERQNRQQMMGEREKNRLRKLNAQGGREWDHDKEDGFSGTGHDKGRGATRGAHGGISSSRPLLEAPFSRERMEGHGISPSQRGRGRGRGGRAGRGDHQAAAGPPEPREQGGQRAPSAADFPELPPATATVSKDAESPKVLDLPTIRRKTTDTKDTAPKQTHPTQQDPLGLPAPLEKGRSWADEVNS